MNRFTDTEAKQIMNKARENKHLFDCTHYNSYVELVFRVTSMDGIAFPQWSHAMRISKENEYFYIYVSVFKSEFLYDLDTALRLGFITIKN